MTAAAFRCIFDRCSRLCTSRMHCQAAEHEQCGKDEVDSEQEDWQYKYRSAFTYAAYNDLDKMGYAAPKRHSLRVCFNPFPSSDASDF